MRSTKLSSNLWVGASQLFLWLFFHPNGWLAYTSEIVNKDFSLLSLSSEERKTINVKRLLLIGHLIYPLLTTIIVGVVLYNIPSVPQENVLLGTTIGFTISVFIGVTISTVLSVAGGITGSIVTGLVSGIVIGMADHQVGVVDDTLPQFLIDSFPSVAKAMGISFIVSAGAISTVLNSISTNYIPIPIHERSIRKRVGKALDYLRTKRQNIVLTLIFSFILGLIIVVGFVNQIMGELMRGSTSLNIATLAIGLLVYAASLFIPIHLNASKKIKDSLLYALLISLSTACIASMSYYLSILSIQSLSNVTIFQGIAFSIGNSVFFCLLYLSTHEAIKRFHIPFLTTWLPTLVTGLGSASFFLFFIAPAISGSLENLEIGSSLSIILLAGVVTLTSNWWISILAYPFQLVIGFILHKLDKKSDRFLLRYHPAFWHDHQFIPLYGLEKHLLSYLLMDDSKVKDNSPKDAIKHLYANSKQQWAAREAQLELDIGYLEKCTEFESMANIHLKLGNLLYGGASDGDVNFFQTISKEVTQFLEVERLSGKYADIDVQRSDLKKMAKKLGTQYDALERSTNKYAPRLRVVAYSWASIVLNKRNNLEDTHPNPYTPGVVLRQQHGTFFGRHHITKQIQQLLWDTGHPSVLLYGQRRMGKTSLLYNLQRMLPRKIITFFIDAQGPLASSKSESHFFENMISQIQEYAEDRQLIIPSPNQKHLSSEPAGAFKNWLSIVQKAIIQDSNFLKTTILILIDEYEELDRAFAIGRLDPHIILGTLRHIIQHSQDVKILFAGSHKAGEFQYWSHFLLNTKVVHLSYLKEHDAIQLINKPVAGHPWKYQKKSIQRIIELTNNHPYLIHLLCYEIVTSKSDQMIDEEIKDVSLSDVEIAIEKSLSSGGQFFDDIVYNQLKNDALTLSLLCHLAQHEDVSRQQLLAISSDTKQIETRLRLLIERELIHYVDDKYRFQVELIRLWFCNWVEFHKYVG